MSNLADSLAIKRAIEQVVDERIAKITDVCVRVYKALVISVNGDKMTVNILGDKLDDTISRNNLQFVAKCRCMAKVEFQIT